MESRCLFEKLYSCSERDPLSQASAERVIKASKQYGDGLHIEVEKELEIGSTQSVLVHRKCVDRYCHKKTIQKAIQERALSPCTEAKPKRQEDLNNHIFRSFTIVSFVEQNVKLQKTKSIPTDGVLLMFADKEKQLAIGA